MKALWLILAVPALVAAFWLINLTAGTGWACLVAFPGVFAVFAWDMLTLAPRRGVTPLQRFEEREQRREFKVERFGVGDWPREDKDAA